MVMASVVLAIALGASASAKAAPSAAPMAAPVLSTVSGTACAPTCELWATTGTLSLPGGGSVTIWGYSTSSTPGTATLPGPTLIANAGDAVDVTLHNVDLPNATSLAFPGQNLPPDTTGVTASNSTTYHLTSVITGTYLYEAGLTANGQTQVAMGLFGALIVRPAAATCTSCAYGAASTFNDEALLVLSEIDPAFNADPANFNMREYAPKYWLINGKAYNGTTSPTTDPITTVAGNTLLLRYANAGLEYHSMGLLGLHQTVIANDGNPLTYSYQVVAETIASGQTLDTMVLGSTGHYALYDAGQHLDNAGAAPGGMLTFIDAP